MDGDTPEPAHATTEELVRLAAVVGRRLSDLGATVSTAESCTGGLVAHILTEISGSSAWFMGGAVVYSDSLKVALVGVSADLIERHGAVSDRVAEAMATGARSRFGTDLALAVTGIAGPTGGTPDQARRPGLPGRQRRAGAPWSSGTCGEATGPPTSARARMRCSGCCSDDSPLTGPTSQPGA